MSMKATLDFCSTKRRTIASPMPEPPPVTSTTLSSKSVYIAAISSSPCRTDFDSQAFSARVSCIQVQSERTLVGNSEVVRVDRIRAVEMLGGGKAQVEGLEIGDAGHGR